MGEVWIDGGIGCVEADDGFSLGLPVGCQAQIGPAMTSTEQIGTLGKAVK